MIEKLNELVDKEYNYKGVNILIKKVKCVSGTFVVMTDKRTYNFLKDEVDIFISELKDKKNVSIQVKKDELNPNKMEENEKNLVPIQEENNLNIRSILFETLEKVRVDKNYIPQANAICNVVSQMINVQKIEMQLKKK